MGRLTSRDEEILDRQIDDLAERLPFDQLLKMMVTAQGAMQSDNEAFFLAQLATQNTEIKSAELGTLLILLGLYSVLQRKESMENASD